MRGRVFDCQSNFVILCGFYFDDLLITNSTLVGSWYPLNDVTVNSLVRMIEGGGGVTEYISTLC